MKRHFIILLLTCSLTTSYSQDTKKAFYLDTSFVQLHIDAFYIGCQDKKSDTIYYLKYNLIKTGNWEIYYDKKFKRKAISYKHRGDTLTTTYYFKNGQKKKEDVTKDYRWLTSAEWCENGQQVYTSQGSVGVYQKVIHYYCDGIKKWEANLWAGTLWGTETRWYANGQKKYEKKYIEYSPAFDSIQGAFDNKPIGPNKYWAENGTELNAEPDDRIQRINTFGFPMQVKTSPFKEKYPGIVPYDIVKGSYYDNTMTAFQSKIYETTKRPKDCKCTYGEIYVSFVVTADGIIENVVQTSDKDECFTSTFVDAIKKLGRWTPANIEGKNVPTLVSMSLKIENLK